jgi:hypothetical protein
VTMRPYCTIIVQPFGTRKRALAGVTVKRSHCSVGTADLSLLQRSMRAYGRVG